MAPAYLRYLPPHLADTRVIACFGLISDTHMPLCCAALPNALHDVFRDVHLMLHAGDVGELWVLDKLSLIAPVIAVHGNDDTLDAQRELPYQQITSVGGQRIVLCHSHHPDRAVEMAMREDDAWQPKLERLLDFGRRSGAQIVVFGHAHIPMTYTQDGILLVNPGAIASGSVIARQARKTVALLFVLENHSPLAVHVDLAAPDQVYLPRIDLSAGFAAARDQFSASLIDPELLATAWPPFEARVRKLLLEPAATLTFQALYAALLRIAHRCWADEQPYITRADLLQLLDDTAGQMGVSASVIAELGALLS
jgi:uncharacterized protein